MSAATTRAAARAVPDLAAAALAGGVVGTLLRWGVSELLPVTPGELPWATLLVNVLGAALLALVAARVADPLGRAFLGSGLLGAFTTMSAFGVETAELVGDAPAVAVLYVTLTAVLGLGAAAAAAAAFGRAA